MLIIKGCLKTWRYICTWIKLCFIVLLAAAAAAKSLQTFPTLCDPIDGSPPGPAVPGILEARTLEWVAISFSKAWKWKVKVKSISCVWLLATPWTAAHQVPPSMGFSRQEYWSGLPLPSPIVLLRRIQNYVICPPSGHGIYFALPYLFEVRHGHMCWFNQLNQTFYVGLKPMHNLCFLTLQNRYNLLQGTNNNLEKRLKQFQ